MIWFMAPIFNPDKTKTLVAKNPFFSFRGAMTEVESRLLWLMVANVETFSADRFEWFYLPAPQLAQLIGLDKRGTAAFEYLRAAGEALRERTIRIPNPEDPEEEFSLGILQMIRSRKSDLRIGLKIHPELAPYLLQIKKESGFTQIDFETMISLAGEYSGRIYANLWAERWKNPEFFQWKISVAEFRNMFELEGKYDDFSDLKRRVIQPVISRLKDKIGWDVKLEEHRQGKPVVAITFSVRPNEPVRLSQKSQKKTVSKPKKPVEISTDKLVEMAKTLPVDLQNAIKARSGEILKEDMERPGFPGLKYDPDIAADQAVEEFRDMIIANFKKSHHDI